MNRLTEQQKASLKTEHFTDSQLATIDRVLAADAKFNESTLTPEQEAALQATGVTPEQIAKVKEHLAGKSFSEGAGAGVLLTPEVVRMCNHLRVTNPRAVERILRS
jgi:hypothetical protein